MAIPYPQICPDSRSFRPCNYAVTQPAHLNFVESTRRWSNVGFDAELDLGYEDLSESDAALFATAYADSRSGFHALDIGTEPAGGIGNTALAERITDPASLIWKFAEQPSIQPVGNALYRVQVKLRGELPSFANPFFQGPDLGSPEGTIDWSGVNACIAPGVGAGVPGIPGGGEVGLPGAILAGGTKTLAIWFHALPEFHWECNRGAGAGGGEYSTLTTVTGDWVRIRVDMRSFVYRECGDSLVGPLDSGTTFIPASPVQSRVIGILPNGTEQVLFWSGMSIAPYLPSVSGGGYYISQIGWRDITIVDRTNNLFYGPFLQTTTWRDGGSGPNRPTLTAPGVLWDPFYQGRNPAYT